MRELDRMQRINKGGDRSHAQSKAHASLPPTQIVCHKGAQSRSRAFGRFLFCPPPIVRSLRLWEGAAAGNPA